MLARLGNVLYWAFAIAAAGLTLLLFAVLFGEGEVGGGRWLGAVLSLALGAVVWVLGWAVRYVLAGQR